MNYSYPIQPDWSTEEIIMVVNFLDKVERVYQEGVNCQELMDSYQQYKQIVQSKMEEKQIDKEFEKITGYSTYQAVKLTRSLRQEGKQRSKVQIRKGS